MDFVAIDFETANSSRGSVCSVGIAVMENGKMVDEYYHLVRPIDMRFDPINTLINGITPEMVENEPEFVEIWPDIRKRLDGKIVAAHYATFDMSVLRYVLNDYGLTFPNLDYVCSWVISKKVWPNLLDYRLDSVASEIGFSFNHHHALEDAKACSSIILAALAESNEAELEFLASKYNFTVGKIFPGGYKKCGFKYSNTSLGEISPNIEDINHSNYFYGKNIAFTGQLISMTRVEAVQRIVNEGAYFSKGVNKKTNILVYGYQDPSKLAKDKNSSSKFLKASSCLSEGANIEIMSEADFIKLLDY